MTTTDPRRGHQRIDAQTVRAASGTSSPTDRRRFDAQTYVVGGGTDNQPGHRCLATHSSTAGLVSDRNGSPTTIARSAPIGGASLDDPFLNLAADVLDDTEANRKANENRLRQLTRTAVDSDGGERGFGLTLDDPAVAQLAQLVQMMKCDSNVLVKELGIPKPAKVRGKPCCFEHAAEANLQARLKANPLYPWLKAQKGVGAKQAARLLAVVRDPYINLATGEPRTVSQLWAYCGHGRPMRRRKGMTQAELFAMGNPVAKSRTWLVACAVLKAQGPLTAAYYDRKATTEGRVHTEECVRCGPAGKPAQPGSPWSDAHRHADALRVLGKTILRELWREAKRLHEPPADQQPFDTQCGAVGGATTSTGHTSRANHTSFAGGTNHEGNAA